MNINEYVARTGKVPAWPYELRYNRETTLECDVLVVGGGVAGCRAAIEARKRGASVILADRGNAKRSGRGGAGVDHWHGAVTNPCSKVTPRQYSDAAMDVSKGWTNGQSRYIVGKEGWDTLLELEQMGVQIRDEKDEFKGSMFQDPETKLLFAYDVDNKHCLRIFGNNIKPCLDKEMRELGVTVVNRCCVVSYLTEDGRRGGRVIGAMGVNDRTGEFFVFKAKAVVVATGRGSNRQWGFAPEITECSSMGDLSLMDMGNAMGWRAGAEMIGCDTFGSAMLSGFGYAPYSMGNSDNTYQGAPLVDSNGVRVQHFDQHGRPITKEHDIFATDPGKFVIGHGIGLEFKQHKEYFITGFDPQAGQKIRAGELEAPFYTDLSLLDEQHRRLIWNVMLAEEGKCRIPIFQNFQAAGFDPARDMLQVAINRPEVTAMASWAGIGSTPANWKSGNGGHKVDWRMQTTLPGLFAAGEGPNYGHGCHGESQTTGRYCGRQAAAFARQNPAVEPNREQIEAEKKRCFAAVNRTDGDIGWKEMNYAISRVMQDYCGSILTEKVLALGERRLDDLLGAEGQRTYAQNPHELCRLLEDYALIDLGHMYMEAARARKCSTPDIRFERLDSVGDPADWNCWLPLKQNDDGSVTSYKLDHWYYLQAPYESDLEANYQKYAELD